MAIESKKSSPTGAGMPPIHLRPGQKQYKVVTQADEWFMGKFNPERLGEFLNALASVGWRVVAADSSDRAAWFGVQGGTARQELIVILERDVTEETVIERSQA